LNADVNWGRLISIYTLGGAFAVHFVNTGQKDLVKDIPLWIKEVIETTEDIAQWINKKGGWEKLSYFAEEENTSWSPYITTVGCLAAAGALIYGLRFG